MTGKPDSAGNSSRLPVQAPRGRFFGGYMSVSKTPLPLAALLMREISEPTSRIVEHIFGLR